MELVRAVPLSVETWSTDSSQCVLPAVSQPGEGETAVSAGAPELLAGIIRMTAA